MESWLHQQALFWLLCTYADTFSSRLFLWCSEGFLGWFPSALCNWPEFAELKSPRQYCCGQWSRTMVLSHPIECLEETSPFSMLPYLSGPLTSQTFDAELLPFCHFMLISTSIRMNMSNNKIFCLMESSQGKSKNKNSLWTVKLLFELYMSCKCLNESTSTHVAYVPQWAAVKWLLGCGTPRDSGKNHKKERASKDWALQMRLRAGNSQAKAEWMERAFRSYLILRTKLATGDGLCKELGLTARLAQSHWSCICV